MDVKEPIVLKTMMWGMVPPWFAGSDPTKMDLKTINARLEGLQSGSSVMYKPSVENNRRCVIVSDGIIL